MTAFISLCPWISYEKRIIMFVGVRPHGDYIHFLTHIRLNDFAHFYFSPHLFMTSPHIEFGTDKRAKQRREMLRLKPPRTKAPLSAIIFTLITWKSHCCMHFLVHIILIYCCPYQSPHKHKPILTQPFNCQSSIWQALQNETITSAKVFSVNIFYATSTYLWNPTKVPSDTSPQLLKL